MKNLHLFLSILLYFTCSCSSKKDIVQENFCQELRSTYIQLGSPLISILVPSSNAASITLFGGIRPTKNTPFAAPTIVDGSTFFDGSGDYIVINTGGTNIFNQNSDFTVEMFVYPVVWPSTNDVGLWHTQGSGGNANALALKLNTNGTLYIDNQSTGSI